MAAMDMEVTLTQIYKQQAVAAERRQSAQMLLLLLVATVETARHPLFLAAVSPMLAAAEAENATI